MKKARVKVQEIAGRDGVLPTGLEQPLSVLISGIETVGRIGFGLLLTYPDFRRSLDDAL